MAQLNDLIVTGKASFLNEIKGKIDWTNILNKPNTFTPTIGTSATTAMAGNTNVNNVTQTATTVTSDTKYELLFSNTADNTNRTEGTRKSSLLTFSPEPAGVKLTMNYDGSRPNNYGDITIKGNNDNDSCITLHSSSAGMSYMWIKHPTPGVGIFLEGGSDSSSEYSKGMINTDDFIVSGYDWEGNNITWDGTNTSLKAAVSSKLNKAGDTMTGALTFNKVTDAIHYTGSKADYTMIQFIDNTSDTYGNGIAIGGGGQTIIGGGESASVMKDNAGTSGSEEMWIGNDGDVHIYTNIQPGWASRKTFTFSSAGNLTLPGDLFTSTWDGTNTSLKTALANKISKETNTTVSWTSNATGRTVTCMLAKIGTIVICSISGSTDANHSITAWTQTQLGAGQIPAGYRPSSATEGRISIQTGGAAVTVNTVGTVAMQTWSNLGGQMAFGGTFWWKTS